MKSRICRSSNGTSRISLTTLRGVVCRPRGMSPTCSSTHAHECQSSFAPFQNGYVDSYSSLLPSACSTNSRVTLRYRHAKPRVVLFVRRIAACNLFCFLCVYCRAGISRDSWHKRRATGGKKSLIRKKRKFELGRPPANTKVGVVVRVRDRGRTLVSTWGG